MHARDRGSHLVRERRSVEGWSVEGWSVGGLVRERLAPPGGSGKVG